MEGIGSSRAVVVYDQLGSGNSDRMLDLARDATLPRFVEEVAAVREQLGLKEVHLVGHSWGATVALEYLLTANPTGVRSVVFVGPLISTPRWIRDANGLVEKLPGEARDAIMRVIPGAGHSVVKDRPEAFNEIIAAFIAEAEKR